MLEVVDLAVSRGGRSVFEELGFRLEPGQLLLLEGPNGAGKSTLLRACAGLLVPQTGRISWHGRAIESRTVHYLGHALGLKGELSVREILHFAAALAGGSGRFDDAQRLMDLDAFVDLPVRMLSAGQRQRTALASLMVSYRPVWLLDEPEAGLDIHARRRLSEALAAHQAQGGVAIVATHNQALFNPTTILSFGP